MLREGQVVQRTGAVGVLPAQGRRLRALDGAGGLVVEAASRSHPELRVPDGGPYSLEQRDDDGTWTALVGEFYVGDLFVLAGQSNMQGSGLLHRLPTPHPLVRLFGMDRRWQPAVEPLHRLWLSPDPVHHHHWDDRTRPLVDELVNASIDTESPHLGAGLGVTFANDYVAATGVPVGLVPAALGGSGLGDWAPDHPGGEGHSLYAAMLARTRAAGGRVAGLLWHQGEAETQSDDAVADYAQSTRALFDAFRRDLGQPDLPVYLAQIASFPILRELEAQWRWTRVKLAQQDPLPLGAQGVVATHDLSLSDPIHLDTESQQRLGRRFARLATGASDTIRVAEVAQHGRLTPGPEFVVDYQVVEIRFSGLAGPLRCEGPPTGFSVHQPDGCVVPCVWRVELHGDSVKVWLAGEPVPGGALYYGWGCGAAVRGNLTDSADMAVPAFGPIPLEAD